MTREELIKRIKETAYLEGDFTLRSGKKSKYYLDKYLFETCPDILKALGQEFAKYITDDVGYGTGKMVEGVLKKGDVVLLVEDIATTGGQVLEAAKVITEAGAKVDKIVCVVDRRQGAEENITGAGYKFESILTKDDLGIRN
ncbi:MAG: orotate phosphoribosyltransferase [Planctomycetota bacterium]|jgi:orotate phosphoribosyltransferase